MPHLIRKDSFLVGLFLFNLFSWKLSVTDKGLEPRLQSVYKCDKKIVSTLVETFLSCSMQADVAFQC